MDRETIRKLYAEGRRDFRGADLERADLRVLDLAQTDLRGVNLSRADLAKANLSEALLSQAVLSGANLRQAILNRADLSEANLRNANLQNADLRQANLQGARCDGAKALGADIEGANLEGISPETLTVDPPPGKKEPAVDAPVRMRRPLNKLTVYTLPRSSRSKPIAGKRPTEPQSSKQRKSRRPRWRPAELPKYIIVDGVVETTSEWLKQQDKG